MLGSKSLYELHNNSLLCHSVNHQHLQNDNNLNGKNNISHSNSHVYLPVTPNDTHLCPLYAQVVYLSDESDIENAKQPNDSHVTVNVSADESDSSTEFVHPEATNLLTNGKTSDNKIEKYNNYTIKPSDIYTDEDVDDIKNDYECNLSTSGSNNPQNPNCRVTPIEVDYLNHHPLPAYLETIFEEDEEGYLSSSSSSSLDTETSSSSAISSPHNDNQSYQVHSQSEEEILSPGEEVETIDSHSHHHSHQQFFSGHHHHHHQHPEAALISCPGTIIIPTRPPERPRFPTQRALHQLSQSSAIGLICDHNQNSENQRRRQENEQEVGITGNCRIEVEQEVEEGEEIEEDLERQEEEEEDDKDRHRGRRRRKKSGQLEDDSHLPPEIPPLPPSPLHHLHHNLYPFHHQLYTNNFTGFPSLEALEEYHRQHHLEHHLHHHHQEHHQNHFHLPLQRSSTLDSPSGGSDFQLPCSPESEDSDMTSVIKGPSYKARAPKNIWSPGSTTSSSSSDLASTPGPVTPGPMTMACATQTTPTRSESLNVIKCATLPHGFRPVKLTQSNHGLDDIVNDGHQQQQLLHEQHMMAPSTTASSPASGALVASSVVTTGDDNSFTVMPSSPSETSVRQPESLVSPVASQSGVPQVNSSSSPPSNQPRTPSEQGETSSDVPSAPAEPPTPPITIKGINKYWTLPRQSSSSSATGVGSYPEMHHPSQESFLSQSYPNDPNISSVVTDKAPPQNAKFLYETPTAKYYTLPTSQTEVRSIVVPPPLKYEGIGPVNESGVPVSLRSGVKDEYGSDWYKTMYKRLHKCDRPRSELDQPIRVKLKSSRSRDRMDPDYFSEDENTSRVPPRNIADYEPGRSSISLREKHKFYADLINYIDTIFSEVFSSNVQDSSSETNEDLVNRVINANQNHHHRPRSLEDTHRRHTISKRDLHHKNCVFNALTSPNGYESDSSYIIKKKEPKSAPNPASRSTYCAIQRGDMDIPFSGLQKPAPAPRAHKESPHRFDEGQVNIHYKTPIQTLVKGEGHPFNIDDLTKFQREMARIHSGNDYDRNYSKESQRKHHFTPNQQSIVHLDRYQKAFAQKAGSYSSHLLARVLFDFHALSSREISAKKGDIVIIHRPVNHHWVEVEDSQSGLKGLVPRSYLDYEQEGIAKAKFDFDAKTAVEISFKKGDVLKLIRKVDENWYEGINEKGLMGIFPCSYVETLKTPLYIQLNNNLTNNQSNCNTNTANGSNQYPSSSSASRLTSNIAPTRGSISSSSSHHHHQQQQQHHLYHPQYEKQHQGEQHSPPRPISPIIGFNGINSSSSSQPPPPPPTANTTPYNRRRDMLNELSATGSNGIKSKLYRVIYPYKPRQVDELELFPGDLLAVSMHCDDGWFVGYSALTGNYGTFPGNYVEPLM
ncbi:sorbin and SH3 domain-containing protein 1 isoform X4 [Tetranychus urticae]|uniref:sorbin and SH3 domain-containing protein 1 isoform X4 n=1 Tax=Tetranychus urticae TaxID=32264 RepID=UPI00077BB322|nr:sorbin and SH3 domain-containing protein 1 isoform X4 [Tetranychus urticae]